MDESSPHIAAEILCKAITDITNIEDYMYKREGQVIIQWLNNISFLLPKSEFGQSEFFVEEQEEGFKELKKLLNKLYDLFASLDPDQWWNERYNISVDYPIKRFNELTNEIREKLTKIKINVDPPKITKEDIAADYEAIHVIFSDDCVGELKDSALEKIQEIERAMKSKSIQKANAIEKLVSNIFQNLKSFQLNRDDIITFNELGSGATAVVFRGLYEPTGEEIAIKQLKAMDLKFYEVKWLRRELGAMATLSNPNVVKFIGATVDAPYWIVMEYCPSNLYNRIQARVNPPTPTKLTQIAYQIAEGMAYLHSQRIIHRDLKSCNILMTEDDDPKITDFGFARFEDMTLKTYRIGTPNYEAPEVIKGQNYSFKADVFSFGLTLYEMVTRRVPYSEYRGNEVIEEISMGARPYIPSDVNNDLRSLIEDCWAESPDSRPTFDQILLRMRGRAIAFPGADEVEIRAYYKARALKARKQTKQVDGNGELIADAEMSEVCARIIDLLQNNPGNEELSSLIETQLNFRFNYSHQLIAELISNQAPGLLIQVLHLTSDPSTGGQFLVSISPDNPQKQTLINLDIVNAIGELLKLTENGNALSTAKMLLMHLNPVLKERHLKKLICPLIMAKLCNTAAKLMQAHPDVILAREIEPALDYVIYTNSKRTSIILSHYAQYTQNNNEMAKMLSTSHVISLGSVDLARKLCAMESFVDRMSNIDVADVCRTISTPNVSDNEKAVACVLANVFPTKVLAVLSGHQKFLNDIMSVGIDEFKENGLKTNIEMAARLLFKLCQFKNAAGYMLSNEMYIYNNAYITSVFSLMIRISAFFPERIFQRNWIVEFCIQLLDKKLMLEISLRILGILSTCTAFKESDVPARVEASIGTLVKNGDLSPLQLTLAVGVLYNISAFKPIESAHRQQLVLAESGKGYAGMAFKILSRGKLARPTNATSGRLVDLAESFLEGDDAYGLSGSCAVLKKMAADEGYRKAVGTADTERRLNGAIVRTKRAEIAAELAETLNAFGFRAGAETLAAIDAFLMSPATEAKYAERIQAARAEMRI